MNISSLLNFSTVGNVNQPSVEYEKEVDEKFKQLFLFLSNNGENTLATGSSSSIQQNQLFPPNESKKESNFKQIAATNESENEIGDSEQATLSRTVTSEELLTIFNKIKTKMKEKLSSIEGAPLLDGNLKNPNQLEDTINDVTELAFENSALEMQESIPLVSNIPYDSLSKEKQPFIANPLATMNNSDSFMQMDVEALEQVPKSELLTNKTNIGQLASAGKQDRNIIQLESDDLLISEVDQLIAILEQLQAASKHISSTNPTQLVNESTHNVQLLFNQLQDIVNELNQLLKIPSGSNITTIPTLSNIRNGKWSTDILKDNDQLSGAINTLKVLRSNLQMTSNLHTTFVNLTESEGIAKPLFPFQFQKIMLPIRAANEQLSQLTEKQSNVVSPIKEQISGVIAESMDDPVQMDTANIENQENVILNPINNLDTLKLLDDSGKPLTFERFVKDFEAVLAKGNFTNTGNVQKLTINLNPENLGQLKIELVQQQNEIVAKIITSSHHAKELMESQVQALKQAFVNQNINVVRIDLENPTTSNDNRNQQHQQDEQQYRDAQEEDNQQQEQDPLAISFQEALVNYEI
ncbi:flagellar hook-length control protein FliK [Caldibacillus lycopersici]|uniref:Flagellar hook-length control protein FliK n=1 Tax=Perspicuibacillus lycopersici TaxID=1325689 RepID=A0AAE3LLM8_9BACI|nr:flagellar hook-length control protein FliK [Perspicuibacillus lycopersici]MCU9612101.1 flagellar hook-length control protein FliK [Perspicuibacillus lycopersici]